MSDATRQPINGKAGFTLIEALAAVAISAVIMAGGAGLIHQVALHFDQGTRRVGDSERLLLAVERLAGDFGSARFDTGGPQDESAAFTGGPTRIAFVAAGGVAAPGSGDEAVTLSVEQKDGMTRLVRRRAAWRGLGDNDNPPPGDPVILLEGPFDIQFSFGRLKDGKLSWAGTTAGQPPRLVRMNLRDRDSGADLLAGTEFLIRADAPGACAAADAKPDCLSNSGKQTSPEPAAGRRASQ